MKTYLVQLLLCTTLTVDGDWRAPHQNSVTHVDPHAPLAGLPPGEGNPTLNLKSLKSRTIPP